MTISVTPEIPYTVSKVDDLEVVTAYLDGNMYTTNTLNPNFQQITTQLFEGDTRGLTDLFNAEQYVQRKFKKISERASVSGGVVFFDGDAIESTLSDHLLRLIREGQDVSYLVNFWENIAANPSEHSREHLLRWLTAEDFSITSDGMIVGYKGLRSDGTSIHAGPAIVDAVEINGYVPNNEGSVIELARSTVVADSFQACAYGLHVGTYGYASGFAHGLVVEALVNPRDVVSVPTDSSGSKMRVCRYTVGKAIEQKRSESVVVDYDEDDDFSSEVAGDEWDLVGY
jgi:hypothetical protein